MTARDEQAAGFAPPALPQAVELLTAMTEAGEDPAFFWTAVQRVMADADSGTAVAELVFGLTSLSAILLQHLADAAGTTPEFLLGQLATVYTRPTG